MRSFQQNETRWPQVHPRLLAEGQTRRYILAFGFTSNLHRLYSGARCNERHTTKNEPGRARVEVLNRKCNSSDRSQIPKTEWLHHCQFPAVDAGEVTPEGPGRGGNKPLMRNLRAQLIKRHSDRVTAGNTFAPAPGITSEIIVCLPIGSVGCENEGAGASLIFIKRNGEDAQRWRKLSK